MGIAWDDVWVDGRHVRGGQTVRLGCGMGEMEGSDVLDVYGARIPCKQVAISVTWGIYREWKIDA